MKAILPGRPQSKLQAVCTAYWDVLRIIAYVSGNAVIILKGPQEILQTIYIDDVDALEAVTIEESSGKVAVCSKEHVYIYGPIGRDEGVLKWTRIHDLDTVGVQPISTLSWGSPEELLVGGEQLTIWNIPDSEGPTCIWRQRIANSVNFAHVSPDAGLIASCGQHDRLVKIWRRLSYELDSTRFDVSYLPHPTAVTNVHWRKPWHAEQNLDNLLYTFCADNRIRVWAHADPHTQSVMQYVAEIDMNASIQPRRLSVGSMSKRRYGFVLDSRDFSQSTEKAVQNASSTGVDHALEHLIEIANRSPEVCIVLDGLGHMSAWGLENAGCKNKRSTVVFNVAHVDGMNLSLSSSKDPEEEYAQVYVFAGRLSDSTLTVLVHTFDGKIDWYDAKITEMFDPSLRKDRARLISSWTGHNASVSKIVSGPGGSAILSVDEGEEAILWTYDNHRLLRSSGLDSHEEVLQAIVAADAKHVALLHPNSISVWNAETAVSQMIGKVEHSFRDQPMCLVKVGSVPNLHLSLINASGKIETWRLHLPISTNSVNHTVNGNHSLLSKIATLHVEGMVDVVHLALIGGSPHDDEVVLAISRNGLVQVLSCCLLPDTKKLFWSLTRSFNTNVTKPQAVQAVSSGKVVVVDEERTGLSIWDTRHAWLEYQESFRVNDNIERVAWMTTSGGNSILAVSLQFRIAVLVQLHSDSHVQHDPWVLLREIRLREFTTHSLGDMCWLVDGSVLIGAANQIFVSETDVDLDGRLEKYMGSDKHVQTSKTVVQVSKQMNASLPIFHPSYLHHLIVIGRHHASYVLLDLLHKKLRYWTEGDDVPSDLDSDPTQTLLLNAVPFDMDSESEDHLLDEDKALALSEYLANSALPDLSASSRAQLGNIGRRFAALQRHQGSVDENALRYLYLSNISAARDNHDTSSASYREIVFASRSTSQDILVDHLTRSAQGKLTWKDARNSGLFMWLSDAEAVRQQMEVIARNEYTNTDDRSPVECSLYYLALRKKNVLQGLWRMVPGLREQKNTLKLLANDFEDPKWRTSALKNSYVLLSKRRFMYAAAFFLLGGSLKDAANVCVHQLKDMQLAVAIARVYEGDDGPVLKGLLADQILSDAVERGDGWCASWVFSILGMREKALQAIVRPLYALLGDVTKAGNAQFESTQAKHWRNYDPTLAILYRQLRDELARDSKASFRGGVTEKEESDFVLRCAAQYARMGCDWLGLDLVRNWQFLPRQQKAVAVVDTSSLPEAAGDETGELYEQETEVATSERKRPPPTQFQEPSASSLLDSFGF